MSAIADKQLAEAAGKLTVLLGEVRGDAAIYPRVLQWIAKFTGGRPISEWLADGKVDAKDRVMVARNLVDLLLAKDYSRLPLVPALEAIADAEAVKEFKSLNRFENDTPASRENIRKIVREELAALLTTIAKVLRE